MADIHGSPSGEAQMAAAPGTGPAPAPYGGPDLSPEPPVYGPPAIGDAGGATSAVLAGVAGNALQESGYAHDVNAGLVVPYVPGAIDPIYVGGDNDAGGRSPVAGDVAGAVANQGARLTELQSDTFGQGSVIGDLMTFPPSPLDPGVGSTGTTLPTGGYYDPDRRY